MPEQQTVTLKTRIGSTVDVPLAEAEARIADGWTPASPEEAAAHRQQQEYGGFKGKAIAGVSSAAGAASFGVTDYLATEIGGDPAREAIKASREVNPNVALVGEVAGSLAGLGKLSTGAKGASLLSRSLKTGSSIVRAPARAAQVASEALYHGTSPYLGKIIATGLAAGGEGMLVGAGQALSNASLNDEELTGEALAAHMGTGLMWGGAAGLGIGAGSKLLSGAVKGGRNLLSRTVGQGAAGAIQTASGKPMGGFAGWLADKVDGAASVVSGSKRGGLAPLLTDRELRQAAVHSVDNIRTAQKVALDAYGEATDLTIKLEDSIIGEGKVREIARTMQGGNPQAAKMAAVGSIDASIAAVEDVARNKSSMMTDGINKLRKNLEATRKIAENAKDAASAFMAADSAKRAVGRLAYGAKYGASVSSPAARATYAVLDDAYGGMQRMLETNALWGAGADWQRGTNGAWVKWIQNTSRTGLDRATISSYRGTKGVKIREFNREGTAKALEKLHGPQGEQARAKLLEHLDANDQFVQDVLQHKQLSPEDLARAKALGDKTRAVREAVDKIEHAKNAGEALNQLNSASRSEALAGGALGYALGSGMLPGGALTGAALGILRDPHSIVTRLAALDNVTQGLSKRMSKGVDGLFKSPRIARHAGKVSDEASDTRRRFDEASESVRQVAADPVLAERRMREDLDGAFAGSARPAVDAAVATAMRRNEYLLKNLPALMGPKTLLGKAPTVPLTTAQSFLRRLKAADDPLSVLDDMAEGKLSREAVETVREVYPSTYQQIREQVMDRIMDEESSGAVPYQTKVQLGILLDMPTDDTMVPSTMALMQGSFGPAPQDGGGGGGQPPAQGKAPDIAGAFKTESERLENRDA